MRKITVRRTLDASLAERLTGDLNESQRAAVTAPPGYQLILAGPGSGKTRVIVHRVAYLIATGIPAGSIMLVTFTRRAAREMVDRLGALVGQDASQVWSGTFHHIANRLLRSSAEVLGYTPRFSILDSEDQLDLIRLAMDDAGLSDAGSMTPKPAVIRRLISLHVNLRRPLGEVVSEQGEAIARWRSEIEAVAAAFETRKKAADSMDYDDLLVNWDRLVREFPEERDRQAGRFRQFLIDEMQDANSLQVGVVESIAEAGSGCLTAVGDDAQSIYGFRGASADNILGFPQRHPGARVFHLDVNYRSTPQVVAFTRASIRNNRRGFPKDLVSALPAGPIPLVVAAQDGQEEAAFIAQEILEGRDRGTALSRMAVLYRSHHDGILIQGELLSRRIPYMVRSGQRFFEQAHIKDVTAYLRIIQNPRDLASWRRLLLHLPGVGAATSGAIAERLIQAPDPLAALESAETMALAPSRGKGYLAGFVMDLKRVRESDPVKNPAAAITAVMAGGYSSAIRLLYEHADERLADIEQFAILAAKYDSLERLTANLLLSGDLHAGDLEGDSGGQDAIVLSTIHQAKGLEWSRVFVPRLVEESFPHGRALDEPEGEDEERRIFYVAVSRAQHELILTYPLTVSRGGRGSFLARPSRFLLELDPGLVEWAEVGSEFDLGDGPPRPANSARDR